MHSCRKTSLSDSPFCWNIQVWFGGIDANTRRPTYMYVDVNILQITKENMNNSSILHLHMSNMINYNDRVMFHVL